MFLLLLACVPAPALAAAPPGPPDPARLEQAARQPGWLKLLHYKADNGSPTGLRSAVVSERFFLAPGGRDDPRAELLATVAAFAEPPPTDPDSGAHCRFPARALWLRNALGWPAHPPACPRFQAWAREDSTRSISLVFATGYLSNPASFYGHVLLKFNAGHGSDLLNVSVNYGAIVPDNVDPVSYVVNGVLGGYDGGFSHIQYYFHDHNYGENEQRDLWEYELALEPEEARLLTAHAWELLGQKFRYFFFRHNCAYRMAELLEILEGVEVTPQRPWTIPQSLIQGIARSTRRGKPLLARVDYMPSRQSRFYARFTELDGPGRIAAARAVADAAYLHDADFTGRPVEWRTRVIDALIDYHAFRASPEAREQAALSPGHAAALKERFLLPPAADWRPLDTPRPPHTSRPPGMVRLGGVHSQPSGDGAVAAIRPAYYDPLDADGGHVPFSGLAMLNAEIFLYPSRIVVRNVDFFRAESVSGAVSGLPGDRGRTWLLAAGVTQQSPACERDCLVARFRGAVGRSARLGSTGVAGATVGGTLQNDRNGEGAAHTQASAFSLLALGKAMLQVQHTYSLPLDGVLENRHSTEARVRVPFAGQNDVRLEYWRSGANELRLSVGWYW